MNYVPMKDEKNLNRWTTKLCSMNGNGGLHDQSQFKDAVAMLEEAISEWDSPQLRHIVLTGADESTYQRFIDEMKRKRYMPRKAYKAALETDNRKGIHCHWMLITDASSPDSMFDIDDDSSRLYQVQTLIRRTTPDFEVTVRQPRRHRTPYISLGDTTLNDAADYFSYALKARSKPPVGSGGCYWSSRSAKRTCAAHRPARLVKPKHLCEIEF